MMTKEKLKEVRKKLPYGIWVTDTHEVLFNRSYHPIWRRNKDSYDNVEKINEHEWVHFNAQAWYFNDSNPPWTNAKTEKKCMEVLELFKSGKSVMGLL